MNWLKYFMFLCFFSLSVSTCLSVAVQEASASVVVALSDGQKAALSDVIVVGTVERREAVMTDDGRVMTRHVFRVSKWLKGESAESSDVIEFWTRGGAVDGIVTRVGGEAALETGDEVVVYLEWLGQTGIRRLFPLGLAQGAYVVLRDDAGDKRVIRSDERMERRRLASIHQRASMREGTKTRDDMTLDAFVSRIQTDLEHAMTREEALGSLPGRRVN